MRKLTILYCLTFLSGFANTQSIFSALHLNENREYKTARPKKIDETNTFYNSSGKKVYSNIKTFDEAGMLLKEERYGEYGDLQARLIYTNDTINKLHLSRMFERTPTLLSYFKRQHFMYTTAITI